MLTLGRKIQWDKSGLVVGDHYLQLIESTIESANVVLWRGKEPGLSFNIKPKHRLFLEEGQRIECVDTATNCASFKILAPNNVSVLRAELLDDQQVGSYPALQQLRSLMQPEKY